MSSNRSRDIIALVRDTCCSFNTEYHKGVTINELLKMADLYDVTQDKRKLQRLLRVEAALFRIKIIPHQKGSYAINLYSHRV